MLHTLRAQSGRKARQDLTQRGMSHWEKNSPSDTASAFGICTMNATTAPTLPGLLSARRLLEMGCAETVVRRVLVVEVGLTAAEAATAIVAAQSQAA